MKNNLDTEMNQKHIVKTNKMNNNIRIVIKQMKININNNKKKFKFKKTLQIFKDKRLQKIQKN